MSEARKYGIRLILSLANNWDAYGGKAQYVQWGKAAGLNLTSDDDFFTDPTLKGYYKANVKVILPFPFFFFSLDFLSCSVNVLDFLYSDTSVAFLQLC